MKLILVMALTADGKIGKSADHFPDWTEPADKKLFMSISKEAGVIIMGSKTFDTLKKPLPGRMHVVLTRNKNRRSSSKDLVFTGKKPADILSDLAAEGYEAAVLAGGAQINQLFAEDNLIDELILTLSPKIFGTGLSMFSDAVSLELELLEHRRIGHNTLMVKYKVLKPANHKDTKGTK